MATTVKDIKWITQTMDFAAGDMFRLAGMAREENALPHVQACARDTAQTLRDISNRWGLVADLAEAGDIQVQDSAINKFEKDLADHRDVITLAITALGRDTRVIFDNGNISDQLARVLTQTGIPQTDIMGTQFEVLKFLGWGKPK